MTSNNEANMETASNLSVSSPTRSVTTTAVTMEHSLEAIANVIQEMEMDDPPFQPVLGYVTQTIVQTESSTYCHRFAIYRRNAGAPPTGNPSQQLALFKSYLEAIGITNYFHPYRQNRKTLSGDFNIATKFTFEELQDNKGFQTWLHWG
jgi:hypothetical protein